MLSVATLAQKDRYCYTVCLKNGERDLGTIASHRDTREVNGTKRPKLSSCPSISLGFRELEREGNQIRLPLY